MVHSFYYHLVIGTDAAVSPGSLFHVLAVNHSGYEMGSLIPEAVFPFALTFPGCGFIFLLGSLASVKGL